MGVRVLEGASKQAWYDLQGRDNIRPDDQIIKSSGTGPQLAPFYESLSTEHPATIINRNQAVDGSVTPVRFKLHVHSDKIWVMSRLIFIIRSERGMDAGGWGNSLAPLTNGLKVGVTIDGVDINFTPIPWTSHVDLAGVAYDLTQHQWGQGDEFIVVRLTISKAGTQLRFDGSRGDTFWMEVQDDLTYLVEQRCMCQGVIEDTYLG